ncbi:MAG: AMMECR1 domain-containing protein [Candidatus Gracilibacteria bacterium]|nr:AMMECR1 domain-containing protein [Candidatus Gracilibacteria bacterium]
MLDIVSQIIKYYLETSKIPTKNELVIKDKSLLEKKGTIFITIYKSGNIVGNSGNIVEIENDLVNELIKNTIFALGDKRFERLTINDLDKIKIRIDILKNRILLNDKKIQDLNPVKSGILVIKKDYNKLSVILPNISSTMTSGDDFVEVLSNKLEEEFKAENYIVYEIQTEVLTNY